MERIESFLKRILLTYLPFVKVYDGLLRQPPLGESCGSVDNYVMKGGFKKKMFKFKKVASLFASTVLLGSTIGFAAATTFPSPFVENGSGNVAIVYGSNAATSITDLVAATNIADTLNSHVVGTGATGGTDTTIEGEAYPLFTSGTKLYVNDTLNTVRSTLTKTELPIVLEKGTFSGNVEATFEQAIDIGNNPVITYEKQPTSSNNPDFGLKISTSSGNVIYNATATFSKAINFTHADSKGTDFTLFGQKFTVASSTDATSLVLLKTAEKISLTSDDPSAEVMIGGKTYTVELISASDTSATVKVTDENGNTETKEVNENASKKIQGLTVAVTNADETNLKLSASVIAGAEKVTLTSGSPAATGEDSKNIDGTLVTFTGSPDDITKITFGVFAADSDKDALLPGNSLVDPIFGSFKLDFAGLNIASDSTTLREDIKINPSGDDKIEVNFKPGYSTEAKSITWAKNLSNGINLQYDDDSHNITVAEMGQTYRSGWIVVGNEESGRLVKVSSVTNGSSVSSDKISFSDVFTGETIDAAAPSTQGTTTVVLGGKSYTVTYDDNTASLDTNNVRLNYPDSSGGAVILFPTIKTSKGAKIALYQPTVIDVRNWDGTGVNLGNVSSFSLPDGDGFTSVAVTVNETLIAAGNTLIGGSAINLSSAAQTVGITASIGRLTYNFTNNGPGGTGGTNTTKVYLVSPEGGNIVNPALIVFEEKDDNSNYEAMIVTLDSGASSSNGLDVADVIRTWSGDALNPSQSMPGDSNIAKEADLWGSINTRDTSSSGHAKATISYPDEQVNANLYLAEDTASITGGSGGGGDGMTVGVPILDSEVSSVSAKNWIVVGGSCVNSAAADLLGISYPTCGADWTTSTNVGAGQYLIQTFDRTSGKVATLVAGFNAGDTTNAATYLRTQTGVDTTAGKKYIGTTGNTASIVTE